MATDITTLVAQVNAHFGEDTVRTLADRTVPPHPPIPTFIPDLDTLLKGGLPGGQIVEIYGMDSTKEVLALMFMAAVQRAGGIPALIDLKQVFRAANAQTAGCDPARILVSQPDSGEQALDVAEALIRSTEVRLVLVNALEDLNKSTPEGLEQSDEDHARMVAKGLRKLAACCAATGASVVFLNRPDTFDTSGQQCPVPNSNALKFYAGLRMLCSTFNLNGHVQIRITKNKFGIPGQTTAFPSPAWAAA